MDQYNLRLISVELLEFVEDVRQSLVLLGRGGSGDARVSALLLLQRPVDDDGGDQIFGLGGEGLSQDVAEATGVDDGQHGVRFTASDVLEDRGALHYQIKF